MKKYVLILVLLILVVGTFLNRNDKTEETIRIGTMPTQSASIYAVGVEKGFFKKQGADVTLTVFKSAPERDAAAIAGQVDGFMTDIMGLINLKSKGYGFTITSDAYENFAIMAKTTSELAENQAPRIGLAENTVTDYITDLYAKEKNIKKIQVSKIPDRMGALLNDEIEMGVFPEPFISLLEASGYMRAFDTATSEVQPVVMVFSDEIMSDSHDSLIAFYRGYNDAVNYMKNTDYDDYKSILVDYGLVSEKHLDLVTLPVNHFSSAKLPAQKDVDQIVEWMLEKKMIEEAYTLSDLSTDVFIK